MRLLERQNKILKYLSVATEWTRGSEIAKVLDVSDRTIRNDILEINNFFKKEIIISLRGRGYKLKSINKEEFKDLDSHIEIITNKERIIYILKNLIINKQGCNIFDLAESLYISDSTLQSDILKIKKILKNLGIDYAEIYTTKDIIQIKCNIIERYGLLYEVAIYNIVDLNIEDMQKYFKDINLLKVYKIMIEILRKFKYESRYLLLTKMTIYIALIIEARDKLVCNVEGKYINSKYKEIVKNFSERIGVSLNEASINIIASKMDISRKMHIIENNIRNNKKIYCKEYRFYKEKIVSFSNENDLGIEKDEKILTDLIIHIMVTVERIKLGVKIHNPLRKNLRDKSTFLFWIADYLVKDIEKEKNVDFDFNDLSFIVAYLSIVMDKRLRESINIEVFLIVSDSRSNLNYIYNEIKSSLINEDINITTVCRFSEAKELYITDKYDLVIATSKEDAEFITDKYLLIRKNFDDIEKDKILNEIKKIKQKLFKEKIIYNLDKINVKVIKEAYYKVEKVDKTSIQINRNGVEFIYKITDKILENEVIILIPKNESNYKMKIIFCVLKNTKEIKEINWFISFIIELSMKQEFLESIRFCSNYKELQQLICRLC